jgi:hypothetical protein
MCLVWLTASFIAYRFVALLQANYREPRVKKYIIGAITRIEIKQESP